MTRRALRDPITEAWAACNPRYELPTRLKETAAERAGTAEGAKKARRQGVHPIKVGKS
jgi:hypothetical protein